MPRPLELPSHGLTDQIITVRELADRDADAFAAGSADDAVRRFAHLPLEHYTPGTVREQIRGVIADGLRSGQLAVLAIADATDDRFLGSITLFGITGDTAEIGFWLTPDARGTGATNRAIALVAAWAHEHGIRELGARADIDNHASQRVLERNGFRTDGEPVTGTAPSGHTITGLHYRRTTR
ncbi:GNAT family N-acetyltransferase [Saccharopolyspora taberi]|uniref:GNAT family N-acetyltransferase n=1 Tax=Saccharopolyspora taberi TaxID=60895 RepID=A0ABN3VDB1_9PSEU